MNDTDEDVRTALVTGSSDLPPGIDLLRGVRERQVPGRRSLPRFRMQALVPAGAVAVAVGAAVLAMTLTASVATAPTAFAAVSAAAAKTSGQSFLVTVRSDVGPQRLQVVGEFDPAHGIGKETGPDGFELIYDRQYTYVHVTKGLPGTGGKTWLQIPALTGLEPNPVKLLTASVLSVAQANPENLLALLKSAGTVTSKGPASGPGWTGAAYSFTATAGHGGTVTGIVDVDQQGRVRDLAATVSSRTPGDQGTTEIRVDIAFSDFGRPVSVTRPPAREVYTQPTGAKGGPVGGPPGGPGKKAANVKIAASKSGG